MKLPAVPQPFVLKGPLEPPVGGNSIYLHAPESLQYTHQFIIVNIPFVKKQKLSGARTVSCWCGAGATTWPVSAGKRSRSTDLWRSSNHANIIDIDFVNIIGEPALVAEPGGS